MWRALFVAFLLVHAGIHVAMWASPEPKDPKASLDAGHSWLLGDQRALALSLALVAAGFLAAAGIGLWAHADWWRLVAVVGLAVSFGLMALYFHPWFLSIEVVNAGLLLGILWLAWPSKSLVGA
jgi:hypothetical protein